MIGDIYNLGDNSRIVEVLSNHTCLVTNTCMHEDFILVECKDTNSSIHHITMPNPNKKEVDLNGIVVRIKKCIVETSK